MSTLHPIFEGILATHFDPMPLRRAAYVSALRRMDWNFEFSDDHRVWRRGRDQLEALRHERKQIDADGILWRANAPAEFHAEVAR